MKGSLLLASLGLVLFACSTTVDDGSGTADDALSGRAAAACENKTCGERCRLCPPGDINCFETAVVKTCNADGRCSAGAPVCEAADAGPAWTPCGGKACGDSCKICPPGDPDCFETAVVKMCQADGACAPSLPVCTPPATDGGSAWTPCGGKACGERCKICPPGDPNCFESMEIKVCNAGGACVSSGTSTCN